MSEQPKGQPDRFEQTWRGYWELLKRHVWLRWVTGIVAFVVIVGIAGAIQGTEETSSPVTASDDSPKAVASDESQAEAPEEAPAVEPVKPSYKQRVKDALKNADGPVEDPEIIDVEFGDELTVTTKTPKGGIEGASTKDLDRMAGAIFAAVYGNGGFKKTGTVVVFEGGLVSTKTGQDLPDVNTGIYVIKKSEARDIDWSDEDAIDYTIDWSLYREFAHTALKQEN